MSHGPFEQHLREAIALNRERAPQYAALSAGASRTISYGLITAEYLVLPIARGFDRAASPYHAAGIHILHDIFVPMSLAPALGSISLPPSGVAYRSHLRPLALRRRVERALAAGEFSGAELELADLLRHRVTAPHADCLVWHLLESAHRIAALAPSQEEQSLARGLPSPAPLLRRLLRLHLVGLLPASILDRRAHLLHARGVPILLQDLPAIPRITPSVPAAR